MRVKRKGFPDFSRAHQDKRNTVGKTNLLIRIFGEKFDSLPLLFLLRAKYLQYAGIEDIASPLRGEGASNHSNVTEKREKGTVPFSYCAAVWPAVVTDAGH
jgi:hypothetical protein